MLHKMNDCNRTTDTGNAIKVLLKLITCAEKIECFGHEIRKFKSKEYNPRQAKKVLKKIEKMIKMIDEVNQESIHEIETNDVITPDIASEILSHVNQNNEALSILNKLYETYRRKLL